MQQSSVDLNAAVQNLLDDIKRTEERKQQVDFEDPLPMDAPTLQLELRKTRAALKKLAAALHEERANHEQTQNLLRLALKPGQEEKVRQPSASGTLHLPPQPSKVPTFDGTGNRHVNFPGVTTDSAPDANAQGSTYSSFIYDPLHDYYQRQKSGSPNRGYSPSGSGWTMSTTGHSYTTPERPSGGGRPRSNTLQELITKATQHTAPASATVSSGFYHNVSGTSTPRRSVGVSPSIQRKVNQYAQRSNPGGAGYSASKQSSPHHHSIFGSSSPRFQKVMLSGDHGIYANDTSGNFAQDIEREVLRQASPKKQHRSTTPRKAASSSVPKPGGDMDSSENHLFPADGNDNQALGSTEPQPRVSQTTLRSPDVKLFVRKVHP